MSLLRTLSPTDPSLEQMLENLVIAIESDAHINDISRVSGFMQKVRTINKEDDLNESDRAGGRSGVRIAH